MTRPDLIQRVLQTRQSVALVLSAKAQGRVNQLVTSIGGTLIDVRSANAPVLLPDGQPVVVLAGEEPSPALRQAIIENEGRARVVALVLSEHPSPLWHELFTLVYRLDE